MSSMSLEDVVSMVREELAAGSDDRIVSADPIPDEPLSIGLELANGMMVILEATEWYA